MCGCEARRDEAIYGRDRLSEGEGAWQFLQQCRLAPGSASASTLVSVASVASVAQRVRAHAGEGIGGRRVSANTQWRRRGGTRVSSVRARVPTVVSEVPSDHWCHEQRR